MCVVGTCRCSWLCPWQELCPCVGPRGLEGGECPRAHTG